MSATTQIAYIADYFSLIRSQILNQFWDSPNIMALVSVASSMIQTLEDDSFDIIQSRLLHNGSYGELVLYWGPIVGEEVGALSQDEYRRVVVAKSSAVVADGSTESVLAPWIALGGAGESTSVAHYPAGYMLYTVQPAPLSDAMKERIRKMMDSVKPAGIQYDAAEAPQTFFGFDDDPSPFVAGFDTGGLGDLI